MGLFETLQSAVTDRYRLEREIGRGGMATVFLAEDLKHHRKVAIKILHPELAAVVGTDRFLREIEAVASLTHPHVLPLFDSGEADGLLFYTMPFVQDESLRVRLDRQRQLPVDDAIRIAREVAEALNHAHRHGLVHRDIKPGNILLEEGHAVVTDFGVARAISEAGGEKVTAAGMTVGTPTYMSPEQAAGEAVDERSDVYALGCVLYEMLSGEPPHVGSTPQAVIAKKLSEPPPDVAVLRSNVPPSVREALARALERDPVDRFGTAGEFAYALAGGGGDGRRQAAGLGWPARLTIGVGLLAVVGIVIWAMASGGFAGVRADDPLAVPLDPTVIAVLPFQAVGTDSTSPARTLAQSIGTLFELKVTGEYGRRIAHPGSVAQRWREAGGTPEIGLSQVAELDLGRELGVGALVRGTVVETDSGIVLAASMVDVGSGELRVPTVRVEGGFEQRFDLVDQIIVLLLSRERGYSAAAAPRLAQFEPEAIQAYIAAHRAPFASPEQKDLFRAALAADSNLVDAALWIYSYGESSEDLAELSYAWEHQDRLTERGRAYLQVLASGRYGDIRTMVEENAAFEALARRWPEWNTPWIELGANLTIFGETASEPDSRRRAWEALEHVAEPSVYVLWNLTELAFMDEDTARAIVMADSIRARAAGEGGWIAAMVQAYPWRAAILEGDTAAATRVLAQTPDSTLVMPFAQADGRGIADADRVSAVLDNALVNANWAWARGREREWRDEESRGWLPFFPHVVVYWRLLLRSEDATGAEAIRRLEALVRGAEGELYSPDERTLARCWLTLWRLEHGDVTEARKTLDYLATDADRSHRFIGWSALFEALLARLEGGDVRAALLHMNSVVRELPLPDGFAEWHPMPIEVHNLMLARLLREYGEAELALAAIRRRPYAGAMLGNYHAFPEYLREEALLAASVGDTAGAVDAYRHYFTLRDLRPDHPTWAAQWDSMRVEYGALTEVESTPLR